MASKLNAHELDELNPVDLEANRRGETLYGADSKVPLMSPEMWIDTTPVAPSRAAEGRR